MVRKDAVSQDQSTACPGRLDMVDGSGHVGRDQGVL